MSALMSRGALARYLPSVVLFAALLVAWQAAGPAFGVREYLLPGPMSVARAAFSGAIPWPTHVWITTVEVVGGGPRARALPRLRQHAPQGRGGAAVPAVAGLRHRPQHPHRGADRVLSRGHQHCGGTDPGRRRTARPRPGVRGADLEGVREDPLAQRTALRAERIEDHRHRRCGRRRRRRVRGLAGGPRHGDRQRADQPQHAGGLRGAGLDLDHRTGALRRRRPGRPLVGAVGRERLLRRRGVLVGHGGPTWPPSLQALVAPRTAVALLVNPTDFSCTLGEDSR